MQLASMDVDESEAVLGSRTLAHSYTLFEISYVFYWIHCILIFFRSFPLSISIDLPREVIRSCLPADEAVQAYAIHMDELLRHEILYLVLERWALILYHSFWKDAMLFRNEHVGVPMTANAGECNRIHLCQP